MLWLVSPIERAQMLTGASGEALVWQVARGASQSGRARNNKVRANRCLHLTASERHVCQVLISINTGVGGGGGGGVCVCVCVCDQ